MGRQGCGSSSAAPGVNQDITQRSNASKAPSRINSCTRRKHGYRPFHKHNGYAVPISLGDIMPDPEGTLERMAILSPRDFWRYYHAADVPEDPAAKRMGSKWGEMWFSYLVSDPLVLAGAVPLILQKKAQLTHSDEERSIRIAETKALQLLRERLETCDPNSLGGAIMAVCGRVQIAVQQEEFDVASMHLHAVKRLMEVHTATSTEWLCSAWSDLRVVSSTGAKPVLARFVPNEWKDSPSLFFRLAETSQHLAARNAKALKNCVGNQFSVVCSIFQRLHELESAAKDTTSQAITMQRLYETMYDCCLFHAEAVDVPDLELLAICLKLCAWERASSFIPRGGEIERNLLQRAARLLSQGQAFLSRTGAASNAIIWLLFTLAATASVFSPDSIETWIAHLRTATHLETPSTFKRALESWPTASWWHTRAINSICSRIKPIKGSWEVLRAERHDVCAFAAVRGGMRLKLLVIES